MSKRKTVVCLILSSGSIMTQGWFVKIYDIELTQGAVVVAVAVRMISTSQHYNLLFCQYGATN